MTKTFDDNTVERHRRCINCNIRFNTIETRTTRKDEEYRKREPWLKR